MWYLPPHLWGSNWRRHSKSTLGLHMCKHMRVHAHTHMLARTQTHECAHTVSGLLKKLFSYYWSLDVRLPVATSVSAVQDCSNCNLHCHPREHGEPQGISWSVSGVGGTPGAAASTANSVSPEPPKWGILWTEEKSEARLPGRTWGARETAGLLGKLSSNSLLGPQLLSRVA